jgi:hypothetical protein
MDSYLLLANVLVTLIHTQESAGLELYREASNSVSNRAHFHPLYCQRNDVVKERPREHRNMTPSNLNPPFQDEREGLE